jgi:hypothetical protein
VINYLSTDEDTDRVIETLTAASEGILEELDG